MHVRTVCPLCLTSFKVDERALGKLATCKNCGQRFVLKEEVELAETPTRRSSKETAAQLKGRERTRARGRGRWRSVLLLVGGCTGLVVAFVGVFLAARGPRQLKSAQLVSGAEQSVALIHDGRIAGTGFMIAEGILATSHHVVAAMLPDEWKVYFPAVANEPVSASRVVFEDATKDVCLLEVDAKRKPLAIRKADTFRRGEDVLVIGNPAVGDELILENAVTRGLLSSETVIGGQRLYQLSASVNPGNSGGPVLNSEGEVIALVTLKAAKQEGIAFGVPAADLLKALEETRQRTSAELVAVNDLHTARAAFRRAWLIGLLAQLAMDSYVDAMDTAISAGLSASNGLASASARLSPTLQQLEKVCSTKSVDGALRRVQKSSAIGDEEKKALLAFWVCVREQKSYVDSPRGNLLSYRQKARELTDEFNRLAGQLEIQLDVKILPDGP